MPLNAFVHGSMYALNNIEVDAFQCSQALVTPVRVFYLNIDVIRLERIIRMWIFHNIYYFRLVSQQKCLKVF